MTQIADALALRDALVPLIKVHGRNALTVAWRDWVPVRKVDADGYAVTHGGPFATYEGKQLEAFHLIEVSELLAMKWWEDGTSELLAFERGEWESAVVAAFAAMTVH